MTANSVLSKTLTLLWQHSLWILLSFCAYFAFSMLTVSGLLPTVTYWDMNQSIFLNLAGSLLNSCVYVLLLFLPLSRMFRYQFNRKTCFNLLGGTLIHYLISCAGLLGKSESIYEKLYEGNPLIVLFLSVVVLLGPVISWFILPFVLKNVFAVSAFSFKKIIVPYLVMFAAESVILIIQEALGLQYLIENSLQLGFGYLYMLYLTTAFCVCSNASARRDD